jgi:hypothetical protein
LSCESAIAKTSRLAAVELDLFCCAKTGTRTVLADKSSLLLLATHGLNDSQVNPDADLAS